jgi:hypothetical protein
LGHSLGTSAARDSRKHFGLLAIAQDDDDLGLNSVGRGALYAVFQDRIYRRLLAGVLQQALVVKEKIDERTL